MDRILQNINTVQSEDLIRELSPEAFTFYTETMLSNDWQKSDKFNMAKFVRIGVGESAKIILGSMIEFGPLRRRQFGEESRSSVLHKDLLSYATKKSRLSEESRTTILLTNGGRKALSGDGLLLDAGRALLLTRQGGNLMHFSGYSSDFGRANQSGREETAEAARMILGPDFEVTSEPY